MQDQRNALISHIEAHMEELDKQHLDETMMKSEKVDHNRMELNRKESLCEIGSKCMLGTDPVEVMTPFNDFKCKLKGESKYAQRQNFF